VAASTDTAGIIAPPPLLTLLCILAGLAAEHVVRLPLVRGLDMLRFAASAAMLLAALFLFVAAVRQFQRHHTTPNPYRPSSAIVSSGVYGFSRNPIYVAFMLVVLAVAVGANLGWLLVALVVLFLLLHFGVVRREERYLAAKFGSSYAEYRTRVRRWL
jgi:protein-S-isoprenylcysteine O-methyltransferase Ste14